MNKIRGAGIGMIFQDPLTALNPLMSIGKQIEENLDYHTSLSTKQKRERVLELLESVDIPNPVRVYDQYPHELSGGMRQRVMIAIAIACRPSLIIADEPTTALDVTIQSQILDLLKQLQQETGSGIILITHDLGVVAEVADRVVVMYAGEIVESADVFELFRQPQHPYTRSLLASMPGSHTKGESLHVIGGIVPSLQDIPRNSCRFAPRIPWIQQRVHEDHPQLNEISLDIGSVVHVISIFILKTRQRGRLLMALLELNDLRVHYPVRGGFFQRVIDQVKAVDGVSISIEAE